MKLIQRLFRPLHDAWQVFFTRDVKLQRSDRGLAIVLADRGATTPKRIDIREQKAREQERCELALMQAQLQAVLQGVDGAGETLRPLVFVADVLQREGWSALKKLPVNLLRRALEQLEGLVTNWSPTGLANLRSKMAVAILEREDTDPGAAAGQPAMPGEDTMQMATDGVPTASVVGETSLPYAGGDEAAALAAAYASLGVVAPAAAGHTAGAVAAQAAPTPAQLAAQALQKMKADPPESARGEPLEYYSELGSRSAKAPAAKPQAAQPPAAKTPPRAAGLAQGELPPLTLRELEG